MVFYLHNQFLNQILLFEISLFQSRNNRVLNLKLITKLVKKKHYNFLETLAEAVFDELFKDKRIAKIMLKIEKLEILKQCSSVGIQITKKRSHDKL